MARRLSNAALDVLKDFAPATPRSGRRMSLRNFYMVEEGNRGNMTASFDNANPDGNNHGTNGDASVYTLTVTGGYDNKGFKGDSDNGGPIKPRNTITDDDPNQPKLKLSQKEKWRILKNVTAISAAFMVQFTAFQGTANLQSSINAKDGLGTVSLCSIYAAIIVSCLFVPTFLIKRLTAKWTLCVSMLCYVPYIGAQFYPKFYTLVPTGVLLGIGAAPMWASKGSYLTTVGNMYAKITDQPLDAIVVRFFGFFFLAWQTAELWGNLISSLVLSNPHGAQSNSSGEADYSTCGANFCATNGNANLDRPDDAEIYEITGIYLSCIVIAVIIIAIFVDPLTRYGENRKNVNQPSELQLIAATATQLKKPYQQLLIPITVWIGMEQAFIGAEFTQAYVACALGIPSVGYVMVCFGVINAICSVFFGSVMKYIGRLPIMILGAVVHFALIAWFLIWKPHPSSPAIFFIASSLWGVGDAVWQTQVNGLYGTLFRRNKEAAFSNFRLWESSGFVIAYAYSTHLCAKQKLYSMLVVLIIGVIMYLVVEFLHTRKLRRQKEKEKAAAIEETLQQNKIIPPIPNVPEETDDEREDIDDEIVVTHL